MNKKVKTVFEQLGILVIILLLAGCSGKEENTEKSFQMVNIDFSDVIGKMKPVNGINNGPKSHAVIAEDGLEWILDATEYYRQCRIPFVRTHDTEYPDGSNAFIDVHCIFPDMTRDPEDAKAYRFTETDIYIKNILDAGAQVYYRLGESIGVPGADNPHQQPPEDYTKWAEVCAHIVAHYNEGWNSGFFYNIRYWQIWNEPDQDRQWKGTIEEYYELYRVTARRLKKQFPDIFIGICTEASVNEENLQAMLEGIRADGKDTPLDFLGWHLYTDDPRKFTFRANLVRNVLNKNGYSATKTYLDEWNYVENWNDIEAIWEAIRQPSIASFYAASLITMQNDPVDGAMYYDGSLTGEYAAWCGLYDNKGKLLPGYNAFYAFSKLVELGKQVRMTSESDLIGQGVYVCAADGDKEQGILISNIGKEIVSLKINIHSGYSNVEQISMDKKNPEKTVVASETVDGQLALEIKNGEWLYIRLMIEE